MRTIRKIERSIPNLKQRKKVAVYARVSMESERRHHYLSAQVSYYSSLIQKNPDWEYAGGYADYGISNLQDGDKEAAGFPADAGRCGVSLATVHKYLKSYMDVVQKYIA